MVGNRHQSSTPHRVPSISGHMDVRDWGVPFPGRPFPRSAAGFARVMRPRVLIADLGIHIEARPPLSNHGRERRAGSPGCRFHWTTLLVGFRFS